MSDIILPEKQKCCCCHYTWIFYDVCEVCGSIYCLSCGKDFLEKTNTGYVCLNCLIDKATKKLRKENLF